MIIWLNFHELFLEPEIVNIWVNIVGMPQKTNKSASWGNTAFLNLSKKVHITAS